MKKEIEGTKVVIRIRKSKKDRQSNGHENKYNRTNNVLQKIAQETDDRETETPLNINNT
jgi:hypothetical protein